MTFETFFQKFDQFADAPNAVDEFRKIILHLAVHGSLVEQSDEDEPASEMLQRLSDHKPSLLGTADLPKAWENVALRDLLTLQKGKKPISLNTERVGLPYLDIAALARGELRQFTEDEKCPRAALGDLVIVCDGSRSGLVLDGVAGVLGSTVSKVRYAGFVRDYLKFFLRSLYDDLNGAKKGAAIPHLDIPRFLAIPAPIPPLAEQKRIVAKVDELMTLCDRLEAQQQERERRHAVLARASLARFADEPAPANLTFLFHPSYAIPPADLRKSILTLAVQGKLVPQDPNDEPAEELLTRLASELNPEQRRNQAAPLAPLPEEALQYELPESWKWARFRDAAIIASNLVKPGDFLDFTHLAPDNIEKGNGVLLPCRTVREDKVISSNHRFYPGQIVYSKIRPNLAKVVIVDFEGLCSADMYPIDALIDPLYLQRYMLSESFLVQAVRTDTRVAMPKINQMELNTIAVPVPPLAEQRRIVAKVEQLMTLVDALETQLVASRDKGQKLLEAVLAELTLAS